MNIPLGLTYFSLLQAKGFSKVFSNMTVQNYQFFWHSDFFMVQLSHPYMTTGKTTVLTRQTFVGKVMVLLSNTLSMFVITFLPRRKKVSFNFMAAVTTCSDYGAQENKVSVPTIRSWELVLEQIVIGFLKRYSKNLRDCIGVCFHV